MEKYSNFFSAYGHLLKPDPENEFELKIEKL